MDFTDELKKKREHLSAGSLKTYNSLLKTVYRACFGNTKTPEIKNFKKVDDIIKFLEPKTMSSRKTYLASLVVMCPDVEEYKKMMNKDMIDYKHEQDKQEMNDKQIESNISSEEIRAIYEDLKKTADFLMKKKTLSISNLQSIQDFIIVALLGGIFIVPRRSLDYCELKFRNYKDDDNYILKNKLVFHKFKTAKFHEDGQTLDIPKPLQLILKRWIDVIPSNVDNVLFNSNLQPLSNVTLNQRLNRIFKGAISVNQMRHTYLTEKYGAMMKQEKKMEEDMKDMGSSTKQAKIYVKFDEP
jgi:hypothetical protein